MSDDAKHTYRDIVNMIKEIEHIDSTEKILEVSVERILNKNLSTNEKIETIVNSLNFDFFPLEQDFLEQITQYQSGIELQRALELVEEVIVLTARLGVKG